MNEGTKELFEEFFTEKRWLNWGPDMDFLKKKLKSRMKLREEEV